MPSIINSDDGVVSGTSGLKTTGGNDGLLNIQTNGSTAISISSGQRSTFPTTIGVGNATPSTSGSGITFPATQSASSDANTLDDYEEGTFTPTFTGGTTNPTITYVRQVGSYVKVGRLVYVTVSIATSSFTGGSGFLRVSNLPFTNQSQDESDRACPSIGYVSGFSSTTTPVGGIVLSNSTNMELLTKNTSDARDNMTTYVNCPPASNVNFYFTLMYRTSN